MLACFCCVTLWFQVASFGLTGNCERKTTRTTTTVPAVPVCIQYGTVRQWTLNDNCFVSYLILILMFLTSVASRSSGPGHCITVFCGTVLPFTMLANKQESVGGGGGAGPGLLQREVGNKKLSTSLMPKKERWREYLATPHPSPVIIMVSRITDTCQMCTVHVDALVGGAHRLQPSHSIPSHLQRDWFCSVVGLATREPSMQPCGQRLPRWQPGRIHVGDGMDQRRQGFLWKLWGSFSQSYIFFYDMACSCCWCDHGARIQWGDVDFSYWMRWLKPVQPARSQSCCC